MPTSKAVLFQKVEAKNRLFEFRLADGAKGQLVKWKWKCLFLEMEFLKGWQIMALTLKNGAVGARFTFFGRFHTPLAQVSNTSFIDRICKIKVKIKKDKVQSKIVGYENGVNSIHTENSNF